MKAKWFDWKTQPNTVKIYFYMHNGLQFKNVYVKSGLFRIVNMHL